MNPMIFNNQLFNSQFVNSSNYKALENQILQNEAEQNKEIANAVKALQDYYEAVRKIDPQHKQQALNACLAQLVIEMNRQQISI